MIAHSDIIVIRCNDKMTDNTVNAVYRDKLTQPHNEFRVGRPNTGLIKSYLRSMSSQAPVAPPLTSLQHRIWSVSLIASLIFC